MPYAIIAFLLLALAGVACYALHVKRQLNHAYMDATFGCLTRAGGEKAWSGRPVDVLFFDVDFMHDLNSRLGYTEVDSRIRTALHVRSSDTIIARWYSGDEIIVITPTGDGLLTGRRLLDAFRDQGLTFTGAVVKSAGSLSETVTIASREVQALKSQNVRNTVVSL